MGMQKFLPSQKEGCVDEASINHGRFANQMGQTYKRYFTKKYDKKDPERNAKAVADAKRELRGEDWSQFRQGFNKYSKCDKSRYGDRLECRKRDLEAGGTLGIGTDYLYNNKKNNGMGDIKKSLAVRPKDYNPDIPAWSKRYFRPAKLRKSNENTRLSEDFAGKSYCEYICEHYFGVDLDEELNRFRSSSNEAFPILPIFLGGAIAASGLVAADCGAFGDKAQEVVQPVTKPVKKVFNWNKGRATTMKFPKKP